MSFLKSKITIKNPFRILLRCLQNKNVSYKFYQYSSTALDISYCSKFNFNKWYLTYELYLFLIVAPLSSFLAWLIHSPESKAFLRWHKRILLDHYSWHLHHIEKILNHLESDSSSSDNENDLSLPFLCKFDEILTEFALQQTTRMKDLTNKIGKSYQLNITKNKEIVSTWICDFKNGDGSIYKITENVIEPDCILTVDEDIGIGIFNGTIDTMKAFLNGDLKIGGDVFAVRKLSLLWD